MSKKEEKNLVVFEVDLTSVVENKKKWWKEIPILSMFFRYKSNREVMKDNNISELPESK